MFTRTHSLLSLVVAATICAVANPAAAETPTIKVVYNDLNLNDAAGVTELYKRVQRAATRYCKDMRAATGTRISSAFDVCLQDAIATTVQKIDRPELSAFHASHAQPRAENS